MQETVKRFVDVFQRAVRTEMAAMREQLGPFEVGVCEGRELETSTDAGARRYTFRVPVPNEKLVLGTECTLRHDAGEQLVTVATIDGDSVILRSEHAIRMGLTAYALVIYPWFLYERLLGALESLAERDDFFPESALALFGKTPPVRRHLPTVAHHGELNAEQQQAVRLCRESSVSFVWGPPGTGKTTTLGHIITDLARQGLRVLVTSTTNAAVDQALAKLVSLPEADEWVQSGQIVRVGQASGDTFGCGVGEVTHRLNADLEERLQSLRDRRDVASRAFRRSASVLDRLSRADGPRQLDMFSGPPEDAPSAMDYEGVFGDRIVRRLLSLPPSDQIAAVRRRRGRLDGLRELYRGRIATCADSLQGREAAVVAGARVVLTTMANMYVSSLLAGQRFDVVLVEEAGMAVLPTLFYCASLARQKVVGVGDPKQLPPIVQSSDRYARRAMGRNIFEVTVPQPHESDIVVMLETQYRMHSTIGDLVSGLFYDGRLKHDECTRQRQAIADSDPFPGDPVVVLDTEKQTRCQVQEGGYSRRNEETARTCVALASDAARSGLQSVAIITPYVEQSRLIRRLLAEAGLHDDRVECRTVHRFQGHERDMVILDTVDTEPLRPGVLLAGSRQETSAPNLLNVSISRARGKLVIVSDVGYFRERAPGSAIDTLLSHAIAGGSRVGWAGCTSI